MPKEDKKFRFLLILPFHLSKADPYVGRQFNQSLPKEQRVMNYDNIKHLLEDVEWDLHPGPLAPYGDWPVENREEFC